MDNNDLKKLLTSANKFFHSQYDFNISVGEARYKNYDLLTVYKINELCKMGKISENERDYLLELYHQKVILEEKMDQARTEKEQNALERKLSIIHLRLFAHNLSEDLSIEYLISKQINSDDTINAMNTDLIASIIYIGDILREEFNLGILGAAEYINMYAQMIPLREDETGVEFFRHNDAQIWAQRIKDRARVLTPND